MFAVLALFVTDDGGVKEVWVWPGDPLASRLIGVMLLTIAATAIYALVRPATTPMALAVIGTYGIAGAVANVWQDFLDKLVKEGYVVVLGAIGVVSLVLIFLAMFTRRPSLANTPTSERHLISLRIGGSSGRSCAAKYELMH